MEKEKLTEKEKMLAGMLYDADHDEELVQDRIRAKDLCYDFNQLRPTRVKEQKEVMKKLLGKTEGAFQIIQPFWCDYGYNIFVGENFITIITPPNFVQLLFAFLFLQIIFLLFYPYLQNLMALDYYIQNKYL